MAKFIKPPVEDDLLDSQYWQHTSSNLNIARQKLGYWIQFVCVVALIIAGFGVAVFSYVFMEELLFPRYQYHPYKAYWIAGGGLWGVLFAISLYFTRAGNIYGKITLIALLVVAMGVVGLYFERHGFDYYDRIRYTRTDELILFSGLYLAGLLAFPAAYFGWRYGQVLKIPQIEGEDWMWKAKTAKMGLKAWRLGTLAFIILGLAWSPLIMDGLEHYQRRLDYEPMPMPEPFIEDGLEMEEAVEQIPEESWDEEILLEEDPAPESE